MPGKIKSMAEARYLFAKKPDIARELIGPHAKGSHPLKGLPEHVSRKVPKGGKFVPISKKR